MNRRQFIKTSGTALVGGAVMSELASAASGLLSTGDDQRILVHRFGVDYVPSRNWYYCYNDWDPSAIARDFDQIVNLGADHLRVMVIWPWFQPNPTYVSSAHLDRLDQLLQLAADRGLDVVPSLYTGWLSNYHFNPPYLEKEPFYTSEKWAQVQQYYLEEVSKRMNQHKNFLGYDIGNEINYNWQCAPPDGDTWMKRVFGNMHALCPDGIHVNGVDHAPWFTVNTFSPEALVAQQKLVSLHCWPRYTGAGKYGKPLEVPYTHIGAGMAALARSYGRDPQKPIWIQEFGTVPEDMPETDIPRWLELMVTSAIAEGVSWFTWWGSHDVDRKFRFNPAEYQVGLITNDNHLKDSGRMFKQLADAYRGKAVKIPAATLPPPPSVRTNEATWAWLLDWMNWKKA